jgi:hypothetical protein
VSSYPVYESSTHLNPDRQSICLGCQLIGSFFSAYCSYEGDKVNNTKTILQESFHFSELSFDPKTGFLSDTQSDMRLSIWPSCNVNAPATGPHVSGDKEALTADVLTRSNP